MARSNYGQVKRAKEAARKARQQKKLDRRQARTSTAPVEHDAQAEEQRAAPSLPDEEMPP